MSTTDPIADMLTRIRNAIAVNHGSVNMPHSNLKQQIANLLMEQGFIDEVKSENVAGFKRLILVINQSGTNPRISRLKRLSKPGRRLYTNADKLPRSLGGRGIVIVSTSRGLMTDAAARKQRVGGELICEVY